MRVERALVAHRGESVDPVAEVEEGDFLGGADVVEGEDVEGARAAPAVVRVEEEVYRVHPRRREIDHAHADQVLVEPVADLEAPGNGGDEEPGVVALGAAAPLGKAGGEKALQEHDVLPRHGQRGDLHADVLVPPPHPPLVAVVAEPLRPQTDGHAQAAFGAAHGVEAVAVAPIAAGQEPAHALVVEPAEHALMIDRLLLLPIRAFTGHLEKIPLQVFTQVRHPVVRPFPAGHRPPPRRVVLLCTISGQTLSG